MVIPREYVQLSIKDNSWGVLERRLDDRNYEGLTKSTNGKDETKKVDVSITDTTTNNDTSNDTIPDNDNNNISNERIDHGIQTTYDDRNRLQTINYSDDEESNQIMFATRKPVYKSYKDACMTNNITNGKNNITNAGSNNITHTGSSITHGNNPPVSSE